jgi:hypothetical protein
VVRDHRERQTGVAVEGRAGGEPSEGLCPRSPLDFHCWAGEDSRSSQAATKKKARERFRLRAGGVSCGVGVDARGRAYLRAFPSSNLNHRAVAAEP